MQTFILDAENFSDMHEELDPQLEQLKIKQKDILNAELLVEEIFWSLIKKGNAAQVKIQVVKKFFGKVQVQMAAQGASYNPLVEIADWDEDKDDEDYFSLMILKANLQRLNWFHKNNFNVVTINVRSKGNSQAILTIVCIFSGLICGLLMREFLSPEIISFFSETIIHSSEKMFLDALNLLITPVVFFSIISGIISMSSMGVGKIGLKLMGCSTTLAIISLVLSCVMAWIFFSGGVPQINTLPATENSAEVLEFSLVQFIVDIIPGNFVSPVLNGKVLQIIFIAILFGMSLNALGEKASLIKELVGNLNNVFTKMISMVIFFVPSIAFFAMITLTLEIDAEILTVISNLFIGQLIATLLMLAFYRIFVWRIGKISVKTFVKKLLTLLPLSLATASSTVLMPYMMKLCTEKLGVSPKISSFAIPIGITANLPGTMIYFITACVMFLRMYGIELDLQNLALVAFLSIVLCLGKPTVPASVVICVVTIVSYFGVPNEIAGLLFCLDPLICRIVIFANVTANVAVATVLARTENLLDEKIYFA
ncbi:MAG: cation:dicarboxylase symporter family transporter [Selenomonadaceae bacterium]|nr:cation:dicarboxylase symporter family transporter [Selenomonadaceae bacterium]